MDKQYSLRMSKGTVPFACRNATKDLPNGGKTSRNLQYVQCSEVTW